MTFLELPQTERINFLNDTHNVEVFYDLFSKHLGVPATELASKLQLKGDFIMNRLYVFGDVEMMDKLGKTILGIGVVPQCCTNFEIRVDLYHLIDKMR